MKQLLVFCLLIGWAVISLGCSKEAEPEVAPPPPAPKQTERKETKNESRPPIKAVQQQQGQETIFRSISPVEAQKLMAQKANLLIVDVRNQNELSQGYIEGSQLVPIWDVLRGRHNLPMNQPILLLCAVGGRSYAAGQVLNRQGYPEIYNLKGGIDAWKQAGLSLSH